MSSSLILFNNNGPFLRLQCVKKTGFYMTTRSVVGPRKSSIALPKAKLAPKRGSWSLLGGLLPIWSTTASWIPAKTCLRSMLRESMRCTQNYKAAASNGQQKGPNSSPCQHPNAHHITTASKVGWIRLRSFASSTIFTLPLANWLLLLQASQQLFPGEMLPQAARLRKCFPRVCWIPKYRFLCNGNKQTYFSLTKMCWL